MAASRDLPKRYTAVAITLHWLIAFAIGSMILIGENMTTSDGVPIEWMFQLHKSIGITVLTLTLVRIIWRVLNPPPPLPPDMKHWEHAISRTVHVGFYALMILLPLSGWLLVSLSPFAVATVLYGIIGWPHLPALAELPIETREAIFPIAVEVHHSLSKALIGLVLLHIAGAIKHETSDQQGVLSRMVPGLFGKTDAPDLPSRGAALAFGGAAFFFVLIAGTPPVLNALTSPTSSPAIALSAQNWSVDYETSAIRFSGTYNDNPFTGEFTDWSASIVYSPDAPEAVEANVTVNTGSAQTGQTLYDNTLEAAEWFNIRAFPSAKITISSAEKTGKNAYITTAILQVKEVSIPVQLTYTLELGDPGIIMQGHTELSRRTLNLGQISDANGAFVSDAIRVDIIVVVQPRD